MTTPLGKVLILGCHDLSAFNPRGKATAKSEFRRKVRSEFYRSVENEKPHIVLHHPHTTDSSRTWIADWNELMGISPQVREYIGAGRYFREDGVRSHLDQVLESTRRWETLDFIVFKNLANLE